MNLGLSFILSIIPLEMDMEAMLPVAPMFSVDSTLEGLRKLPFIFATIGFLIAIIVDRFFYKQTNFLYYNLGFSKGEVVSVAFLMNIIVSLFLLPLRWI